MTTSKDGAAPIPNMSSVELLSQPKTLLQWEALRLTRCNELQPGWFERTHATLGDVVASAAAQAGADPAAARRELERGIDAARDPVGEVKRLIKIVFESA